jgi:diguanylate cyclase (GGDEF)-like protein
MGARGRRQLQEQQQQEQERRLADCLGRLATLERENAELRARLEASAERDPLTGLPTLQAFVRRLDEELERARRHARQVSVAVIDVDGFRSVNTHHGRGAGDDLLRAVADKLSSEMRTSDVLSRSHGDEFVALLPETDAAAGEQAFNRIAHGLEALRAGPVESVTTSVGIAEYQRGQSSEELLSAAAERLDAARAKGGGRVEVEVLEGGTGGAAADSRPDAVAGLVEALGERDRYTGDHSESVLELVEAVARGLALPDNEIAHIRAAALLHDIGKVAIPDEILHKPAGLDGDEWEVMRQHPVIGERILRAIPGMGPIARIVRHEHERFDGNGYPDRLSGTDIPVGARIILACDAYHAMTSDRPYRKAMPHSEAIRELAGGAGTQFDPEVTEILIGCLYSQRQVSRAEVGVA